MKLPKYLPLYIIVLFLVTLFLRIVLINYYNNNLGGIELNVVYGIQRILLGQPLYQDPAAGSFAVIQYTPLYYSLVATLARLVGIGGHDVQAIFVLCRVLALLFNLITISVGMFIFRSIGLSWRHCLAFALPVLMILTSHYYTRGDSLHLLLFVSAIAAYIRFSRTGSSFYIIAAMLCTAGCLMVKQSGILCLAIIGCCLFFLDKRYLIAIVYVAGTFVFAGLIGAICIWPASMHLVYMNAWLGLKNGIDLSFLSDIFISQYFLDLVPFYFIGGLVVWLAVTRITDKTYRILAVGAALSWLFALITGLKKGSSNNYFTEFLVFVLLALPGLLQYARAQQLFIPVLKWRVQVPRLAMVALFILVTSKTVGFFSVVYIEKGIKNNRQEYADEQKLYNYFQNILHISSGEKIFFTERRFLENLLIDYAILPTKEVVTMLYAADSTTFNYSGFITGMNTGLIKYIVTDVKRDDINICSDSLPFVNFDKQKFKLVARVYGYSIYRFEG